MRSFREWRKINGRSVERIILTASGGPFRTASIAEMEAATPEAALRHPVWSMGSKISIDSATMFNKGLELIEAARLFDLPESKVDVLIHPQSVVHGMVCYSDGSVLAQLGSPDMRIPIAHALAWPARLPTNSPRLGPRICGAFGLRRTRHRTISGATVGPRCVANRWRGSDHPERRKRGGGRRIPAPPYWFPCDRRCRRGRIGQNGSANSRVARRGDGAGPGRHGPSQRSW